MRDDSVLLADIVEAADRVAEFIDGLDRDSYLVDRKTQAAVLHEIIVMGEAATQVSASFKAAHTELSWRDLMQFRNFYVHAYHRVDHKRVWRAASGRMPAIRTAAAALIEAADMTDGR